MRSIVFQHVRETDFALDAGCGTSNLAADLLVDGFKNVVAIDISESCINAMKERYKAFANISWVKGSILSIKSSKRFNAVFDKGTMDTLLCNNSNGVKNAKKELFEITQIMKVGGFFFLISVGIPKTREFLFQDPRLGMKVIEIREVENDGTKYYFYVVQKIN